MTRIRGMAGASRALFLLGTVAIAALAATPGFGCAGTGRQGVVPDDDGGGSSSSSGGAGSDSGADGSSAPPGPGPQGVAIFSQSCQGGMAAVDWSPLRRISRVEYDNMVRDLLGDTSQPANGFPPESAMADGVNFRVNTYAPPSTTAVQDYLQTAEALAESAVNDPNHRLDNAILTGIPSCATRDDTCAKDFIGSWANRAYRGQLDPAESAGLFDLYSTVRAQFDWVTGIQAVITSVLESPRFLYVMEFGSGTPNGTVLPLSQQEIAARLALFLWRSVPDARLMNDAAQGRLATAADVLAEARYMLSGNNQAKAEQAIDDFTTQWLELTSIQAKDPQFQAFSATPSLPEEMYEEARLDVSQLVLAANSNQGGTLTDLLTSPASYVDQNLADFYGSKTGNPAITLGAGPTVNSFTKTQIPNRVGILTSGAVMATQAHSSLPSLVLRGKLVRENILCNPIPPPPPNIPAGPTKAPDGGTTRDLLLAHQQKGTTCPSCHQYMDSIGAGFGNFDATGAYQATDANGQKNASAYPAIDSSGAVVPAAPGGFQTTYKNVGDLATQLAGATQVRQCFTLQELRYALGRIESPRDACSAQQVYGQFSSSGFNVQELLLAIVQSDAFRYRSVETAGSACQ